MNILLDTTYIIPAIGINVEGVNPTLLTTLNQKKHQTSISELTLFELSAKGAKHVATHQLTPERVTKGVHAVLNEESLLKLPYHPAEILNTSFTFRQIMNDTIDCLILSTALHRCDVLATEDSLIRELENHQTFRRLVTEINPEFQLLNHRDLENLSPNRK